LRPCAYTWSQVGHAKILKGGGIMVALSNGRCWGLGLMSAFRPQVGHAQMLKGGVIMDVMNPEQATFPPLLPNYEALLLHLVLSCLPCRPGTFRRGASASRCWAAEQMGADGHPPTCCVPRPVCLIHSPPTS